MATVLGKLVSQRLSTAITLRLMPVATTIAFLLPCRPYLLSSAQLFILGGNRLNKTRKSESGAVSSQAEAWVGRVSGSLKANVRALHDQFRRGLVRSFVCEICSLWLTGFSLRLCSWFKSERALEYDMPLFRS